MTDEQAKQLIAVLGRIEGRIDSISSSMYPVIISLWMIFAATMCSGAH